MKVRWNWKRTFYLLVFLVPLLLLGWASAPTVTYEDSGELITAAYTLGIPHEPGYPLFTLLGFVFSHLPLSENIAQRMNWMSVLFSSLTSLILVLTSLKMIERSGGSAPFGSRMIKSVSALVGGWLATFSVLAISQTVVTEVYPLHTFLISLSVYLLLVFSEKKEEGKNPGLLLPLYFFLVGLSLSNHHTSLLMLPLGAVFMVFVLRGLPSLKQLFQSSVAFCCGLLPYLYLPWSAHRKAGLVSGNPVDWTQFLRAVGRSQYAPIQGKGPAVVSSVIGPPKPLSAIVRQTLEHSHAFLAQYSWPWIVLGILGLGFLARRNRSAFLLLFLTLVLWGPVQSIRVVGEVFNLTAVLFWGVAVACGLYFSAEWILKSRLKAAAWVLVAASLGGMVVSSVSHLQAGQKREYRFAERDFNYWSTLLKDGKGLFFVNLDWFSFPAMYFQHVEQRAPQAVFIDAELAHFSWYIETLKNWYPEFMKRSEPEVTAFLSAVKPFEDRARYDSPTIQAAYAAMLHSFIDHSIEQMPVYEVLIPEIRPLNGEIASGYRVEPCGSVYCVYSPSKPSVAVPAMELNYRNLEGAPLDPPARVIQQSLQSH